MATTTSVMPDPTPTPTANTTEPPPPATSINYLPIIIGTSIGGVGLIVIITFILCVCITCCCVRAKRARKRTEQYQQEMMVVESKGENGERPATANAQLLENQNTDEMYLPLELDDTDKGERQAPVNAVNVQNPTNEYYAPMDLNSINHSPAHGPQAQVNEEYYVAMDEDHMNSYNKGQTVEEQEYYTPMDAGIVKKKPLLPVTSASGGQLKNAPQLGGKKGGKVDQNIEARDRSDTVNEYANATEWTAAQPGATHSYANFVPMQMNKGQKKAAAGTKQVMTVAASKPPQTAPKPAMTEELPIYGNVDVAPKLDYDDEGSEPDEEYVVPY